ncbi:MAG: CoA-binding protein [Chloroflexota bacterium]
MTSSESETIARILNNSKTIAVVGISDDPSKPSNKVPKYLKGVGYHIIPVSTRLDEVLGEKAYASLADIPEPVDVVQLIVRGEYTPPYVDQAIEIGAKAIWMQLGISNEEAAEKARAAGLDVVMNHCMMVEHKHLHY